MSVFDDMEDAALELLITADMQNGGLYRFEAATEDEANDGFNDEYSRGQAYLRPIRIAIARGGSTVTQADYLGTTDDTDVQTNDVIVVVNHRGKQRNYVVAGFQTAKNKTLLDLNEVRDAN